MNQNPAASGRWSYYGSGSLRRWLDAAGEYAAPAGVSMAIVGAFVVSLAMIVRALAVGVGS